jgi:hypothetical protein
MRRRRGDDAITVFTVFAVFAVAVFAVTVFATAIAIGPERDRSVSALRFWAGSAGPGSRRGPGSGVPAHAGRHGAASCRPRCRLLSQVDKHA